MTIFQRLLRSFINFAFHWLEYGNSYISIITLNIQQNAWKFNVCPLCANLRESIYYNTILHTEKSPPPPHLGHTPL